MAILTLLAVALPLLAVAAFAKLYYQRYIRYRGLPQLKPSFFWGNMKQIHEYQQTLRPGEHPDAVFDIMLDQLGRPPLLLVDVWPAQPYPLLVVTNHEIAEQLSRISKGFPWSVPKSPTVADLSELLGTHSILMKQGEEWKAMRRRLNPGFAPQHLMTFIPRILEMTDRFLAHVDRFTESGEVFQLEPLCTNLTFDIIGAVTMDVDFKAQGSIDQRNEVSSRFMDLQKLNEEKQALNPLLPTFFIRRRMAQAGKRLDQLVREMVRAKWEEAKDTKDAGARKSVLALSLQGHMTLDHQLLVETADSLKTFLFAGHDTTSILLQWALYELARTPRTLKALRDELDEIFGPDCSVESMKRQLMSNADDIMRKMTYTSAVIKEALRLHPPAGTARLNPSKAASHCVVQDAQGREYNLDDSIIYIVHSILQLDEGVFGPDARDFVPERWSGQTNTWETPQEDGAPASDKQSGAQKTPASAWRPFERGPRNCIGQELANIEARVILAIAVRRYDFTKIGIGEFEVDEKGRRILNEKGQYRVKEELYQARAVTSRPVDGMRTTVSLSEQARATQ